MLLLPLIMARAGIPKAKISILCSSREAKQVDRQYFSKFAADNQPESFPGGSLKGDHNYKGKSSSTWVPHPRSGIYFPEGHESVMNDVPKSAASFGRTYWLRNEDGVDKPDPDDHHAHWDSPNSNF